MAKGLAGSRLGAGWQGVGWLPGSPGGIADLLKQNCGQGGSIVDKISNTNYKLRNLQEKNFHSKLVSVPLVLRSLVSKYTVLYGAFSCIQ